MSNFPSSFDDDTTLPFVNNNITEIGGAAINALRDVALAIQQNIGIGAAGTTDSISARFGVSFYPDGYLKPSAIASLGLVTLPITQDQIANWAQIPESKLKLDHRTQDLFNYTRDLAHKTNDAIGWIATTGIKLEPHLTGAAYRHTLSQIDVSSNLITYPYLKNKFNLLRDNLSGYSVVKDINDEFLYHQFADGSSTDTSTILTQGGFTYPAAYAHTAGGIFINTNRFSTIPQTAKDLQLFAEFIDNASIFLLGTRIQNLYSNGVSKVSRSSSLSVDGYGFPVVSATPAIAYLRDDGNNSAPFDHIYRGDDIIEFRPPLDGYDLVDGYSNSSFDAKFALVKVGDIVRINYGNVEVGFVIKEKKYIQNGGDRTYLVRIAGKNLSYSPNAVARIDRSLVNGNKFGVLAMAPVNNRFSQLPSLIIGSPRGAQALGLGFNPDQLDSTHYFLYLALYPTGHPRDGYIILPPIDVTGNLGLTPGLYTLDSIVEATNVALRASGYNYRFIAFSYQGEFGIMLADSYNNAGFSILNGVVDSDGNFDQTATNVNFTNNVVGLFPPFANATAPDPLGFGGAGANVASPPFQLAYESPEAAQNPTKLFLPLRRNNYYVNGIEKETMNIEPGQILDGYGDGYWVGTVASKTIIPKTSLIVGRVETKYRIPIDLSTANLAIGKTVVVQPLSGADLINSGRFIITDITFGFSTTDFTDITVYDAVHGLGVSPPTIPTITVGSQVAIYFSSDSVTFNKESATDFDADILFKRHFEIYTNESGSTFSHERARINNSGGLFYINGFVPLFAFPEITKLDVVTVSPKLRGYQFSSVNKISLHITSYSNSTGVYDGYLCNYDGAGSFTHRGPTTSGKKGEIARFYDETNTDFIDFTIDINAATSSFTSTSLSYKVLDIQLFPTLSLDAEVMLIGTCQVTDSPPRVSLLRDRRQFGNISEKEFSTSALSFLSFPERELHGNGVLRGFDLENTNGNPNPNSGQIYLTGGLALVNGKFIQMNNQTVVIPTIREYFDFKINWALCVNEKGEYQPIPLLDHDPLIGNPTDPTRLFRVFNLTNNSNYFIDAVTFSDLINFRKDLTILYIVASTTSPGPTISLQVSDVRKYVNDVDNNLPLRLTSVGSQGNFSNPASIFNWIKYNNAFNSTVFVKGADIVDGYIDGYLSFDFQNSAIIDGENSALLTFGGTVTIGSNITFKNLDLHFTGLLAVNNAANNVLFDNCNITIDVVGNPVNNTIFNFANGNNVVFNNCDIIVNHSTAYPSLNSFRGAVFTVNNTTEFSFVNNNLTVDYVITAGSITPGNAFNIVNSPNAIIKNSTVTGNCNKFVILSASNGVKIQDVTFTSDYNPGTGPDTYDTVIYSAANLVNSGQGWIYASISGTLKDILIDNVTFNYTPGSNTNDRYSFINFEMSSNTSILSNSAITNCKFNNTVDVNAVDDLRAAIAIINTSTGVISTAPKPLLHNVKITNNSCNRKQSIILTSVTTPDIGTPGTNTMAYPGLTAQNCVVRDNACGIIGYWTSQVNRVANNPSTIGNFIEKTSGLSIDNNVCQLVMSCDHLGKFFLTSKVVSGTSYNQSQFPSGNVTISNNKCSWIHTGIAYEEESSLQILNNSLVAYDGYYYLAAVNHTGSNVYGTAPNLSSNYAIFVGSNKHVITPSGTPGESNNSSVLISGNTTSTGYWLTDVGGSVVYRYINGYIFSQSSSIITQNTLKGVNSTATHLVLVGGTVNTVTNNHIYRQGYDILSYVGFGNFDSPAWGGDSEGNGHDSVANITDNFFDSPFIDAGLSEKLVAPPTPLSLSFDPAALWIVERNKNQTGYAYYSFVNMIPISGLNYFVTGGGNIRLSSWFDKELPPGTATLDPFSTPTANPSVDNNFRSKILAIKDPTGNSAVTGIKAQCELDSVCPPNVRLLSLKVGFRKHTGNAYDTDSEFVIAMSSLRFTDPVSTTTIVDYTDMDTISVSTPDPNLSEISGPSTAIFAKLNGIDINAATASTPVLIDLEDFSSTDYSYNYITGRGKNISLSLRYAWQKTDTVESIVSVSPIRIKYRW